MALSLNLEKSAQALRLSLEKAGVHTPPVVELAFDLDVSSSYEDEHRDGSTTALIARMVPWGMVFDPDKKLDVFTFSGGAAGVHYVGDINSGNYNDYVRKNVIAKVPGWNGSTDYHYVLRRNLQHFGWVPDGLSAPPPERRGLASWFGRHKAEPKPAEVTTPKKSLVIFNTDGENSDKRSTRDLLAEMEYQGYQMYVLFLAYANGDPDFSFLEQMAQQFNNTGLHIVRDLKEFVSASDEQLNEWLIQDELVEWLKAA